jgi:transposase-like protein
MPTTRRHFTAQEKLTILEEARQSGANLSEVCRRHQIAPGQFYAWEKQAKQAALQVLQNRQGRRKQSDPQEILHQEVQRLQAAVAELTLENLQLKKGRWP